MRALSPQASHLALDHQDAIAQIYYYAVPPLAAAPAPANIYGAPYYAYAGSYWAAKPFDSMGAAFADWWTHYQTTWPWAFPGCNVQVTTYPNGSITNLFQSWALSGTCNGSTSMSGTLVARAGFPSCHPDYTVSGNQCVIGLTATIAQTLLCPVKPLPELPADDLCAQSLEEGAGEDVNKACPDLSDEMKKQAQCVYDKIWRLSPPISYSKPSAAIRNEAYQNHLVNVWNKLKEIKGKDLTNAQKQACAAVIAHVARHGIKSPPSKKGGGAPHVNGKAIDIPEDVAEAMMLQVATFITMPKPPGCLPCNDVITIIGDVQDYVNSASENPPACNLRWGGRFTPYDPVHFQLP